MEEKVSTSKFALQQGLILALIVTIYTLVIQLTGLYQQAWGNYLSYLIYLGFIIYIFKKFKDLNNGFMTLGQSLGLGTLTTLVSGAISSTVYALYIQFVDDSSIKYAMEKQAEEMYNSGMSTEQIEAAEKMSSMFQGPLFLIIAGTIGTVILGFIISLIVGLIMKRNPPQEF
ncbi:hypothetical protein GCM10011506_24770 [Marivirga lumbricoides]|uniref:DUF4199 domain-containing protein n=1 Tax=Marivirga lumbricoides TaxID=1046115 RepID=A0A2T4DQH8_9BACT|nr:hypothetical protein C9994_09380 [Marivirga lumbricoides]GGC38357.1 hypothetical protein GCM10011506_24770 [Marivirga lumbricoides]